MIVVFFVIVILFLVLITSQNRESNGYTNPLDKADLDSVPDLVTDKYNVYKGVFKKTGEYRIPELGEFYYSSITGVCEFTQAHIDKGCNIFKCVIIEPNK